MNIKESVINKQEFTIFIWSNYDIIVLVGVIININ